MKLHKELKQGKDDLARMQAQDRPANDLRKQLATELTEAMRQMTWPADNSWTTTRQSMGRGKDERTVLILQANHEILTDYHDVNISPCGRRQGARLIGQGVTTEDSRELGGVDEGEVKGKAQTAVAP